MSRRLTVTGAATPAMTPHASAEARLVALACAIAPARCQSAGAMRALASGADVEFLWRELERHHLTALAGSRLEAAGALPDELVEPVRHRLRENRLRALLYTAISEEAIRALAAEGIAALPLKGFTLAEDLHGDPGLRRYGDIDLLIHKADLRAAAAALQPLGYQAHTRPGEDNLPDLHLEMVDPLGHRPIIELHWRIHWVEERFAAAMLERSHATDGRRRADPTDELAALLLFFARDGFLGLRLAADIAAWHDVRGSESMQRSLDPLAAAYPGLQQVWWTALSVAERIVGVPAAEFMTPVRSTHRSRLAVKLANWPGDGEPDQLAAEVTLVNLLLSPPGNLPAIARRHVFISGGRVRDYYSLPPEVLARRRFWQIAHPAKVIARFIPALIRTLWASAG